jgi:hypothetical protein
MPSWLAKENDAVTSKKKAKAAALDFILNPPLFCPKNGNIQ